MLPVSINNKGVFTMKELIQFTSFDDHCQALYKASHDSYSDKLHHQDNRGIISSYATISFLSTESGMEFSLVQIDAATARVESWEEEHIQGAVEKLRAVTKCRPDTLLKCLKALSHATKNLH
jgi:hypothetical protein